MEHWSNKLSDAVTSYKEGHGQRAAVGRGTLSMPRLPRRHYLIDASHAGVYFTYREAQCMAQIMRGKTIRATGEALGLSPRTVEYYLKNMKSKLKCRTKSELMQLVASSDLMKMLYDFA